ncbi:hypothetical protein TNCV_4737361 [Trichonephila clavipes]|nr:hypothetical protein TNCV_4737361 [Trichonephila clavipes]
MVKSQAIAPADGSSDSDLDKGGAGIYFVHPNGEHESYRIPTVKISSNFTCELMVIKRSLNSYHSRLILIGNSQLTQDIIALINRAVAAQGTCTLQWITSHVDIFGNEELKTLPMRPEIPLNFPIALPLPMLM